MIPFFSIAFLDTVTMKAPAPGHGEHQMPAFSVASIARAAEAAAAAGDKNQTTSAPSNPALPNTPPIRSTTGGKAPRSASGSLDRTQSDSSRTASISHRESDVDGKRDDKRRRKERKKKSRKGLILIVIGRKY